MVYYFYDICSFRCSIFYFDETTRYALLRKHFKEDPWKVVFFFGVKAFMLSFNGDHALWNEDGVKTHSLHAYIHTNKQTCMHICLKKYKHTCMHFVYLKK